MGGRIIVEVRPEHAQKWFNARIVEVRIYREKYGAVIAELPGDTVRFDMRSVELEDGKWLDRGQDVLSGLEAARKKFARYCAFSAKRPARPQIEDPEAYLKPFVDFLKTESKEPATFVLEALKHHKVVIMGEHHHRPLYWAFNSLLVTQPDFSRHVGTVYMELPSNDQALVDEFLAASEMDPVPIRVPWTLGIWRDERYRSTKV